MESGKGVGRGLGRGLGRGGGQGRQGGGGFGLGGLCVCPKCGTKSVHRQGVRCTDEVCPQCGAKMIREELLQRGK